MEATTEKTKTFIRVSDNLTGRFFLVSDAPNGKIGFYHEADAAKLAVGCAIPVAEMTPAEAGGRFEDAGIEIVKVA